MTKTVLVICNGDKWESFCIEKMNNPVDLGTNWKDIQKIEYIHYDKENQFAQTKGIIFDEFMLFTDNVPEPGDIDWKYLKDVYDYCQSYHDKFLKKLYFWIL